mmetsp:Transcript_49895/g.132572  ORF Transcript_49895/g.132572 Transcript_49895/m.132572 type:complete len:264 (-) Transcript_49895:111-902(-)
MVCNHCGLHQWGAVGSVGFVFVSSTTGYAELAIPLDPPIHHATVPQCACVASCDALVKVARHDAQVASAHRQTSSFCTGAVREASARESDDTFGAFGTTTASSFSSVLTSDRAQYPSWACSSSCSPRCGVDSDDDDGDDDDSDDDDDDDDSSSNSTASRGHPAGTVDAACTGCWGSLATARAATVPLPAASCGDSFEHQPERGLRWCGCEVWSPGMLCRCRRHGYEGNSSRSGALAHSNTSTCTCSSCLCDDDARSHRLLGHS